MSKLIKKKHLKELGFTKVSESTFQYESFEVLLKKYDKENPEISIKSNRVCFEFPGAYTLKDLKDLLFMHYGEEEYNKRFPNQKVRIVSKLYTKEAMMEAFDEGFLSANKSISGEDYQITSANWFKKKYEDK
jgi:hypothetical protein